MRQKILRKYYCLENNLFYIEKSTDYSWKTDTQSFETFNKFYEACHHNLKDADLFDFDFKNCDLNEINLKGAKIPTTIMKLNGIYTTKYEKLLKKDCELYKKTPSSLQDITLNDNKSMIKEDIDWLDKVSILLVICI